MDAYVFVLVDEHDGKIGRIGRPHKHPLAESASPEGGMGGIDEKMGIGPGTDPDTNGTPYGFGNDLDTSTEKDAPETSLPIDRSRIR